jgi:hypothetical protein
MARLEEKERRLAVRIMPHLTRMVGIIATHAEDSIYREQIRRPHDREGRYRFGRNDISHRFPRSLSSALDGAPLDCVIIRGATCDYNRAIAYSEAGCGVTLDETVR